jgi:hypothetical protein
MFDRLRDALEAMLDAATPAGDPRDVVRKMHAAVLDTKVALASMRDGLAETERALRLEQKHLDDAERRGGMAQSIGDTETVEIAQQYATKHRERIVVLEHKLAAQHEELRLGEREFDEMREKLKLARDRGGVASDAGGHLESALREVEDAVGDRGSERLDDALNANLDRAAREARAQAQLEALKKKMGR